MKLEIMDEDNYATCKSNGCHAVIHRSYNYYPSNITNMTEDLADLYNTNNVSRVEYPREFYYDQEMKPPTLLNLDNHNKRKASLFMSNHEDEPVLKKSLFCNDDIGETDPYGWRKKPAEEWDVSDTTNWLICTGEELGHSYADMSPNLVMAGKQLLDLKREEFIYHDRMFGEKLYDMLHRVRDSNYLPPFDTLQKSISDDETSLGSGHAYSDGESMHLSTAIKKRPPGRPRILDPKRKVAKEKLWEFIRNLLLNPKYCPAWIRWENYSEKRFKFMQSDSVAKLWGARKNNKNMTYEKFSRAMRYYYPKKIFAMVPNRRLVYRFGEKATGLETDNPNFDPNYYKSVSRSRT